MTANIVLAILVTSLATYISRFLGALTSEKIGETSKIYKWFNCVAYSTLAALISRILIFFSGRSFDKWLTSFNSKKFFFLNFSKIFRSFLDVLLRTCTKDLTSLFKTQ